MSGKPLKNLPSVHELLESPPLQRLRDRLGRHVLVTEVRAFLHHMRDEVITRAEDLSGMGGPAAAELAERIAQWIRRDRRGSLRPVINATGILVHPQLGRLPLPADALDEVVAVAQGYCSLDMDPTTGHPRVREQPVQRLLCQITGAESALVVSSMAGAILLTLAALCDGCECIVARGQLGECDEPLRMPDLIGASGAVLREVGTTNRTRRQDYQAAIGPATGALMQVQASNFMIQGSAESTSLGDLVELGQRHQLPVIDHCAGGTLIDLAPYGLSAPIAGDSIRAGADVVILSGDRLVGGPQAGLVMGKRSWLERIERHPWAAALRMDKLALAALAGTLRLYVKATGWEESLPLLAMLATSPENLRHRAERIQTQLAGLPAVEACEVVELTTYLEGAAVPAQQLSTYCVVLTGRQRTSEQLARQLRLAETPVIARVHQDRIWLDLRSVLPAQDRQMVDAIVSLGAPSGEADAPPEAAAPSDADPVE